jgi:autotransporter strand-loop-strand O-heptosyltransferase
MWTKCNITYYVDWLIVVTNLKTTQKTNRVFDLKGLKVKIVNESSSLGDNIAWFSSIEAFQKKNDCLVDYFLSRGELFDSVSDKIRLKQYADKDKENDYAVVYSLGIFPQGSKCPVEWFKVSLQSLAGHILGIDLCLDKPKIKQTSTNKWMQKKYICIAAMSTLQNRFWNYPNGWERVVKYLKTLGYDVVCLDKDRSFGVAGSMNTVPETDLFAGDLSLDEIIALLKSCEAFIGLSSGLSWLSWALNKPTILISGAVDPFYEFENKYRVQSQYECTGCFNKAVFDSSNWLLCGHDKKFECTKQIHPETVVKMINQVVSDLKISS